jgi:L-alanine-DL-glutamate epimerase-like enolase superfamily enzyme
LAQESFEDFRDGYLYVPDKPGIGMELNEEVVERYRVQAPAGV